MLRISGRAVTTDEVVQAWGVGGQHPGEHLCESTDGKEPATEAGKEQGGNGSLLKACLGAGSGRASGKAAWKRRWADLASGGPLRPQKRHQAVYNPHCFVLCVCPDSLYEIRGVLKNAPGPIS